MLKTHKPRGHFWTHASTFQQTEGYCNIHYEECLPGRAKILIPDPDKNLPEFQRDAKRKRIERLASGFLAGEPLFIVSARPGLADLRSTIARNEKSINEPKVALLDADKSKKSNELWEDVEDDGEILSKLCSRFKEVESAKEVTAQSSYGRASSLRGEALAQVAASPARNHQKYGDRATIPSKCARGPLENGQSIGQTPNDPENLGGKLHDYGQVKKSLFRPQPSLSSAQECTSDDKSTDTLGCSINRTTSRRLNPDDYHQTSTLNQDRPIQDAAVGIDDSIQNVPYYGEPEAMAIPTKSLEEQPKCDSPSGSQAQLLARQGILAVPRRSWACINDNGLQPQNATMQKAKSGLRKNKPSLSTVRKSLPGSIKLNAALPKTLGKEAKVTIIDASLESCDTAGDRSEPSNLKSRSVADPTLPVDQARRATASSVYASANSCQDGTTPFLFRKKNSLTSHDNAQQALREMRGQRKRRRAVNSPSPDSFRDELVNPQAQRIPADPPKLSLSFEHASLFVPNTNNTLVNQYLNIRLPTEVDSADKSSALKKALRRELRNSGAQLSGRSSETPSSPLIEKVPAMDSQDQTEHQADNGEASIVESGTRQSDHWPGTQVAVVQAQRALFDSFRDQEQHDNQADKNASLIDQGSTNHSKNSPCQSLRHHFHESLPNTQTMVENFEGWSTVKKPRNFFHPSLESTPTAIDGSKRKSTGGHGYDVARRRSNLRFSLSSKVSSEVGSCTFGYSEPKSMDRSAVADMPSTRTKMPVSKSTSRRNPKPSSGDVSAVSEAVVSSFNSGSRKDSFTVGDVTLGP